MIPLRSRIHSSVESILRQISSLVTIRVGRCSPMATMRAPGAPGKVVSDVMPTALSFGDRVRMQAGQRLTGGNGVTVLDEPLDQGSAVLGDHVLGLPPGDDAADRRAGRQGVTFLGVG